MMKYISGLYFKKKTSSKAKLFIVNQVKIYPLVFFLVIANNSLPENAFCY